MKKNLLLGVSALLALTIAFTSCSKDDVATTPNTNTGTSTLTAEQTALVTALRSKYTNGVINLIITHAESDSPYSKNEELKLTLESTGKLSINKKGSIVEIATFEKVGSEYIWKDTDHDLGYALSIKTGTTDEIHEVNISKTSTKKFLAQAEVKSDSATDNGSTDNGSTNDLELNTIVIDGKVSSVTPICTLSEKNNLISIITATPVASTIAIHGTTAGTYKVYSPASTTLITDGDASIYVNDGSVARYGFSGGTVTVTDQSDGTKLITGTDIVLTDGIFAKGTNDATISFKFKCK